MSQSVFRAAFAVSRVHPADSIRACVVLYAIFGRSTGLIAMLLAASLASVGTLRGTIRPPAVVIVGSVLLGTDRPGGSLECPQYRRDPLGPCADARLPDDGRRHRHPGSCLLATRVLLAEQIDRSMWIYLAAELGLVAILSRMSTGAWVNYGVQAVVFASVLDRPCARASPRADTVAETAVADRAGRGRRLDRCER